jgi:hypothetical protein
MSGISVNDIIAGAVGEGGHVEQSVPGAVGAGAERP